VTSTAHPRARVGTSGWHKEPWRGHFYPRELPAGERLRYVSARLAMVEVNTTFHGLKTPADFRRWRDVVPEDFAFSVKGNGEITHARRLRNAARPLAEFLASGVLLLGEQLGPLLWQVPPTLGFHGETVEAFLALLPHSVDEARRLVAREGLEVDAELRGIPDRALRHCFEARNASFRHPLFVELLRAHDVAAVLTNTPEWPAIDAVTSDFAYARLHGGATHFPDGYDDATLDAWAEWARVRLEGDDGRDVFVAFDNPDHGGTRSPFDAMELQRRIGGPVPASGASQQVPLWGL